MKESRIKPLEMPSRNFWTNSGEVFRIISGGIPFGNVGNNLQRRFSDELWENPVEAFLEGSHKKSEWNTGRPERVMEKSLNESEEESFYKWWEKPLKEFKEELREVA